MASAGIGHGKVGSSRTVNGFIESSSSVDWLGKEMLEMRLRDKVDHDDEGDSEPDVVNGVGAEAGHVIRTTIGGRNGQSRQAVSYIAEHVVGTGSYGVVCQAKCRETGEILAIKKVLQDKRYKNRELQIMQMLDHPNIVALKHSFFSTTDKEELYLNPVLEFVPKTVNRIARNDISGGHTLRNMFEGVLNLQGPQNNLPKTCTNHFDPTSCFFPQNLVANVKTPLFLLNAAYDAWQLQASLAPASADPHGYWNDCKSNHARCNTTQIQFLQDFRNQMLKAVEDFSLSSHNGLFINSCFAHCQTERQDTWFADDAPLVENKGVAQSVGDWYFDRGHVKAIDCAYPCDKTCHNLVFK